MKEIIQVRIWNPEKNEYVHSGGTPTMLDKFYQETAKLFTFHNQEYEYATGLKDKNGKEIYEGDIIDLDDEEVGIVAWDGKRAKFEIEAFYDGSQDCPCCAFSENFPLKIIGDIHTTPELSEKPK